MSFTLENVVPWGRSFDEYVAMFMLDEADLGWRILGCADGPSSFNATLTRRGGSVVSVDPIYRFSAADIARRIEHTYDVVMEQTRLNTGEFVWTQIHSLQELGRIRRDAMDAFLADYEQGKWEGRYVEGELPKLLFTDGAFDLALCSHFLFLYSAQLDEVFHAAALRELCRVADEVRVFPLLELGAVRSRHLDTVTETLTREGYGASIERVTYEFQRGGNEMLRLRRPAVM